MIRFLTRRKLLVGGAVALATPYVSSRPARAAGQLVVRNPGGVQETGRETEAPCSTSTDPVARPARLR